MSIDSLASRYKIGTRLYFGFGLILLLLVVLAFVGHLSLGRSADGFGEFARVGSNAQTTMALDRDVTGLRRNAYLVQDTLDEKATVRARELMKQISANLEGLASKTRNAERREAYGKMRQLVDGYSKSFEAMLKARVTREKVLDEEMEPIGSAARKALSEGIRLATASGEHETATMVGLAQESLLLARLNALRFLSEPDQALVKLGKEQTDAFLANTKSVIARTSDPALRRLAEEAASLGQKYDAAFQRAAASTFEYKKLLTEAMGPAAEELAKSAAAIVKSQNEQQDQLENDTESMISSAEKTGITIAVISVLLGAFVAWAIARSVSGPVLAMTGAMEKLAAGDRAVAIPATENKDEIGRMAATVEVFKQNLIKAEELEQARRAEEEAKLRRAQAVAQITQRFGDNFTQSIGTMSSQATEMEAAAQSLTATAEETTRQATSVAAASEQASTNVQTVASAAEELATSTAEIGRQVAQSANIATRAVSEAESTNQSVQGLQEAAQKIGDVVSLINDIAGQTNLLALNATIEAARAGDAGKGFAVVASEVKSLANQTAKATEEIAAQITAMQAATTRSVDAIRGIGTVIREINDIATTIASAVEQQGAATQEIARNVQQAAAGTSEVSTTISGVTQGAQSTGASASQVLSSAGELNRLAVALRSEFDHFMVDVKAA